MQDLVLLAERRFALEGFVRPSRMLSLGLILNWPPSESVLHVFLLFQFDLWIGEELLEVRIYSRWRRFVKAKKLWRLIWMVAAVVPLQHPDLADHHQGARGAELVGVLALGKRKVALGAPEAAAPFISRPLISVSRLLIHASGG